jgi:hypothetical protein
MEGVLDITNKQSFYDISIRPYYHALFCGLVARVPGYRSKDPGFDSRRYQIF